MNSPTDLLFEVASLQDNYAYLVKSRKLSKKALCGLVIPFRDKYGLSDVQALSIARNELSLMDICKLLRKD